MCAYVFNIYKICTCVYICIFIYTTTTSVFRYKCTIIGTASKDTSGSHFVNSPSFVTQRSVQRTYLGMNKSYST